jgi:hypothetical protein
MITIEDLRYGEYSEEELEKNINSFYWGHWLRISRYQKLSESFIEKHKDLVNWLWISEYQTFSENFILNNLEYIDIGYLEVNKNIPKETIEKVKFMKELAG